MSRNHTIDSTAVKFSKYGLGNRSSGRRLRAASKLIDEHERSRVGFRQHHLHVGEERAVGAEVVVYGLVVADVHHNPVEDHQFRCLGGRDEHSPLKHILQKPESLEAHGLSACIRAGNQEYVLLRRKRCAKRDNLPAFLAQVSFQQWMTRLTQVQFAVFGDYRHPADKVQSNLCLRHEKVYFPNEDRCVEKFGDIGAQKLRKFVEYAHNLPLFGKLEFADFVVEFNDFGRLDVGRFPGGGLVVDKTRKLLLVGSLDRD